MSLSGWDDLFSNGWQERNGLADVWADARAGRLDALQFNDDGLAAGLRSRLHAA